MTRDGRDWEVPELKGIRAGLVVVHTIPSATRLWPIYCMLAQANSGVVWDFVVAPDRYNAPVLRFLADRGVVVVSWEDLVKGDQRRYGIALAAARDGLELLRMPVIQIAHGALREKWTPLSAGAGVLMPRTRYGTGVDFGVHQGRTVARYLVQAHRDEVDALDPELRSIAWTLGDPMVDQFDGHLDMRESFRADLDIGCGQRLVTVTSTAGRHCLWRDWPELLHRLVTELPQHRYQVIAILHPHLWYAFGEDLLNALRPSLRRGLRVVRPDDDWPVPVIAADWVLGDHGSVFHYATRSSAALLTAAFHHPSVYPGSARSELGRLVPSLSRMDQIEARLIEVAHPDVRRLYAHAGERLSSEPGAFAANVRRLVHDVLKVREPTVSACLPPLEVPRLITG
ncbi:hypothetical protein [Actinophytocola sp.]|uniref:hypothetical protein n=1 Tax=Actinophytocola sp. TaxID=1872138 RepID=UPI002ED26EA4